ncbi:MAG: site-2 protease family protein [Oscillospiraceae bacterium]|nr:site-2 protease family protein [Oscillospiraceae bacterium]
MSVLIAIVVLCVIILVHELGHFGAAKLFKMNVPQFNLGMGPLLLKKNYKGTQYGLRLFPIGGSVLLGEDDTEESDDPNDFRNKPVWQRIIVIGAGAFLNLVLGLILCIIIYSVEPIPTTVVSAFGEEAVSNTGTSALRVGDRIVKVNGMNIVSASEIFYRMDNSLAKEGASGNFAVYEFVVIRNKERVLLPEVKFAASPNPSDRGGMVYTRDFWIEPAEKTFLNVLNYSARNAIGMGRIIWLSLIDIIMGTYGLNEISGPVGIAGVVGDLTAQAVNIKEAVMTVVSLSALITINLGMVNLLPIPALDGARILFLSAEGIRRKPVNPAVEGMIHFVGFALLMLLILVVTFNDVRKMIVGG